MTHMLGYWRRYDFDDEIVKQVSKNFPTFEQFSSCWTVHHFSHCEFFQARRDKELIRGRIKSLFGLPQRWKVKANIGVSSFFFGILMFLSY